jgi:hypothetical protein
MHCPILHVATDMAPVCINSAVCLRAWEIPIFAPRFNMPQHLAGTDTLITSFWNHVTIQGHREVVFLLRESQLKKALYFLLILF